MIKSDAGLVPKKKYLQRKLQQIPDFYDPQYTLDKGADGFTYTPKTYLNHRIEYKIFEFDEVIDSAESNPSHWQQIAGVIEQNYEEYDSFIVIHGTDTLAYTASALSFMLENLSKTVVLTGA